MEFTIASRYNGPPRSGNGGYSAGSMAQFIDGTARVRLHVPPPLDRPLRVEETDDGVAAFDDDVVVMSAHSADLSIDIPEPPSIEEAAAAVAGYPGFSFHAAPTCFVCGTDRPSPDGLAMYPGPVDAKAVVAAPWTPPAEYAEADGTYSETVLWGVLDCPGAWAATAADPEGMPYFPTLGTMTAAIDEPVTVGESLIIVGWHLETERRKLHTGAALFTSDGTLKARARHIEIKVPADWTEK